MDENTNGAAVVEQQAAPEAQAPEEAATTAAAEQQAPEAEVARGPFDTEEAAVAARDEARKVTGRKYKALKVTAPGAADKFFVALDGQRAILAAAKDSGFEAETVGVPKKAPKAVDPAAMQTFLANLTEEARKDFLAPYLKKAKK